MVIGIYDHAHVWPGARADLAPSSDTFFATYRITHHYLACSWMAGICYMCHFVHI